MLKGFGAMTEQMRASLKEAVIEAINDIGIDRFKRTSLFMSNERATSETKLAA